MKQINLFNNMRPPKSKYAIEKTIPKTIGFESYPKWFLKKNIPVAIVQR